MPRKLTVFEADEDLKPHVSAIAIGDDRKLEEQLIKKSHQPNILKYTPNDATKRFGDKAMLDTWRSANREIHWLIGPGNDLAGVIWYGKKTLSIPVKLTPVPEETVAIRLYEGYTGRRLAVPFMKQSLAIHIKELQDRGKPVPGLWLQTDVNNPSAIATYGKLGYSEVFRDDSRVTMVLAAAEVKRRFSQP